MMGIVSEKSRRGHGPAGRPRQQVDLLAVEQIIHHGRQGRVRYVAVIDLNAERLLERTNHIRRVDAREPEIPQAGNFRQMNIEARDLGDRFAEQGKRLVQFGLERTQQGKVGQRAQKLGSEPGQDRRGGRLVQLIRRRADLSIHDIVDEGRRPWDLPQWRDLRVERCSKLYRAIDIADRGD
jgi:hypothetical protein